MPELLFIFLSDVDFKFDLTPRCQKPDLDGSDKKIILFYSVGFRL